MRLKIQCSNEVGHCRVLYIIGAETKTVTVMHVAHRREVYE
jgi:mRNA-degrading endonuclease RelE of RelBE toxin-antitoxin system